MKKCIVLVFCFSLFVANAQKTTKVGYIDMAYILEKVPEYNEAKNNLEIKANTWKQEIETKKNDITKLKDILAAERVLLTKELISEKEEEIKILEKEILEYQQKRFGPQGDLYIQKSALVKPIQDQIFTIVQDYADKQKYDFIFDKSSDLTILYTNERFDISDQVIKAIERAGRKVELTKKQQKIQEVKIQREIDVKENPEILEKEKALENTKDIRAKALQDRKDAAAIKKKELDDKRIQTLKEREETRLKLQEEQKLKRETAIQKAKETKEALLNKNKPKLEPRKD